MSDENVASVPFRLRRLWSRHSEVQIASILLALIAVESVLFWLGERRVNPNLDSPLEALWCILVFLLSGADVQPNTLVGRVIAMLVILEGVVIVSMFIAFVTAFHLRGGQRVNKKNLKNHIVICGWTPKARRIIRQLQSEDIRSKRPLVLLADLPENPIPEEDVYFVSGDPTRDEALRKAGIEKAYGAIVLADDKSENPDARSLLITLAVERLNPRVYTSVEVYDPENICHLERADADEIICLNQFGEYLILQSSVSHGISKLFASLLNFGEGDEIYRIPVPSQYVGRTFRQAFLDIGGKRDCILIAAERDGEIMVNPKGAYTLQNGDYLFVISPEEPAFEPEGLAQALA